MDYQQAIDYLYSFPDSESRLPRTPAEFNLPQTAALLRAFGEPQQSLRCVVVAGTKGKGSTSVFLEAIARAAGLRTGLWTSPHLHSYRERIQVSRQPISQAEFIAAIERLPGVLEGYSRAEFGEPTIFQLGFALALRYFADQNVDLAILEVGLGGRYDSANVVTPALSIITSISYDHMAILGDTLTKIATEKAGIIKAGVPAITTAQDPEAMDVIVRTAARVGAPLYVAAPAHYALVSDGIMPLGAALPTQFDPYARYGGPTKTALRGTFQRDNARPATGAALLLRDAGLPIGDDAIAAGLAGAQWPGRMEVVEGAPTIVLDGAHNGDSAAKLLASLEATYPGQPIVFVLGVSQGHSAEHILETLLPRARAVVLTQSTHPRAMDTTPLAELARPLLPPGAALEFASTPTDALARARALAGPDGIVCVTGSLFVVAGAREALPIPLEKD
ncbi:folylpolyglutamate synthase [Kouleothrix aurantiaca]|uniref:tetrahydrofolate synthase n=1 Tax=Kouleothrix aurantiaca TaxID=186479 RepID=A0A0P9HDZ4_9CHLR|nr:folylpolyglutamate synthase [Kouleothrix aurantiaca]